MMLYIGCEILILLMVSSRLREGPQNVLQLYFSFVNDYHTMYYISFDRTLKKN